MNLARKEGNRLRNHSREEQEDLLLGVKELPNDMIDMILSHLQDKMNSQKKKDAINRVIKKYKPLALMYLGKEDYRVRERENQMNNDAIAYGFNFIETENDKYPQNISIALFKLSNVFIDLLNMLKRDFFVQY